MGTIINMSCLTEKEQTKGKQMNKNEGRADGKIMVDVTASSAYVRNKQAVKFNPLFFKKGTLPRMLIAILFSLHLWFISGDL